MLAAYSLGIEAPGETMNVNGTCEITLVCLPKCYPSRNYNIRCHAVSGRWLTLYVMNALGVAYEWFRKLFCSEMSVDAYYGDFMPKAIDTWLDRESGVTYVPYLMGSRYSLEPLRAEFLGMTQETSREELLAAIGQGALSLSAGALEGDRPGDSLKGGNPRHRRGAQSVADPCEGQMDARLPVCLRGAILDEGGRPPGSKTSESIVLLIYGNGQERTNSTRCFSCKPTPGIPSSRFETTPFSMKRTVG